MELHDQRGARATLALYPVADPTAYGLVRRSADGEIREFVEKPDPAEIDTDEISAGAYVLERDVLDLVPEGRAVSIEREVFPKLVGDGLYARRLDGYWMDIGTPDRYLQASWDILDGRVETDLGGQVADGGRLIDPGAEIAESARLGETVAVDDRATIGADVKLGPRAVIGRAAQVGQGAEIESTVLHRGCRVGRGARVREAILAAGVEVGERAVVEAGAVIGEGTVVAAGWTVEAGARVPPAERIG